MKKFTDTELSGLGREKLIEIIRFLETRVESLTPKKTEGENK